MASKKKAKKVKKTSKKVFSEEKKVSENVKVRENRQVAGVLLGVLIIFAVFLGSYSYYGSLSSFEFEGREWNIIEEPTVTWYHANFSVLYPTTANRRHNLYIRVDPRENDVASEGDFQYFKYGGVISFAPEVSECRGELFRELSVMGSFLKDGVGMKQVSTGTTDLGEFLGGESEVYATCDTELNRSVIVVRMGEESSVVQNAENPFCYELTISNCEDSRTLEKFMTNVLRDMDNFDEE